ncbi:MAG: hypothetical protein AAGA68_23190 [Pseudomonadota bacterium]
MHRLTTLRVGLRGDSIAALGLLLLVALSTSATAAAAQVQPAHPELGRVPVSAQFRFPDDFIPRSQSTSIVCQVMVSKRGDVGARKCAQHGGGDRLRFWLRNEILHRLKRAKFLPAQIDGERVAVSMPIRAQVDCDSRGRCEVSVFPNAGLHTRDHGNDYYGPQEIIGKSGTWYDRLVASADCDAGDAEVCKDISAFAFGASVQVGADGLVAGVGVVKGVDPGAFPVDAAFEHLVESRYIPARENAGSAMALVVHTPTLHKRNSRYFPRDNCREDEELGSRLGRDCYTMQEMAAFRPEDDSRFLDELNRWLGQQGTL